MKRSDMRTGHDEYKPSWWLSDWFLVVTLLVPLAITILRCVAKH